MTALETERLSLRPLTLEDAAFMLRLVNEPSWLRFIGDRGVRDVAGAKAYLAKGALDLYARGVGPLGVSRKGEDALLGICGLIKRPTLDHVDLGFAFLPEAWGQGYARESGEAILRYAGRNLGLTRIVALTAPDNDRSIRVLEHLGFGFERLIHVTPDAPASKLFGLRISAMKDDLPAG